MRTVTFSVPTAADVTTSLRDSVTKARSVVALGLLHTARFCVRRAGKLEGCVYPAAQGALSDLVSK